MKPTYLYIKQHSITGLKYFGKTIKDPYKYNGSGIMWQKHLQKYGKEYVKTLWVSELFTNEDTIRDFAGLMSEELNIIESSNWANLIPETGIDTGGGMLGKHHSDKAKKLISEKAKQQTPYARTPETIAKIIKNLDSTGRIHTEETKAKMRESHKNRKPISEETRQKLKDSIKNRPPISEETREKMRLASIERMRIRRLKKESK